MSTHIKLSSFYFFYFAVFGIFIPYSGLYYQFLGFDAIQIGQLSAVFVITKLVAPNLLGWVSDQTGLKIFWVKWCSFLTFAFLLFFANQSEYYLVLLTVFLFSFFFHSSLPLFESYTFSVLKISNISKAGYGKIRLWGSVGFIFSVIVVGGLFDLISMQYFPLLVLFFAFIVWFDTVFLKEQKLSSEVSEVDRFWQIVKQPSVIALLLVSLLIQFSHGSYYGFYSIFLSDAGYNKTWIALFWAIGVIAEIVVFLYMVPLFKHNSAKGLMLLSLWLTMIRWFIIPLGVESLTLLFLAQLLHAASYGLFHAAAIYLIDGIFTGKNQSRGQAVYASISHGLGGALGLLLAGYIWFNYGANTSFYINAVLVVFAIIIAYKWISPKNIENAKE